MPQNKSNNWIKLGTYSHSGFIGSLDKAAYTSNLDFNVSSLTVDSKGNPIVICYDNSTTDIKIFKNNLWKKIVHGQFIPGVRDIAVDSKDQIFVLSGNGSTLFLHVVESGSLKLLAQENNFDYTYARLEIAKNDLVFISTGLLGIGPSVLQFDKTNLTFLKLGASPISTNNSTFPAFIVDNLAIPYICFWDNESGKLFIKKYLNNAWVDIIIPTDGITPDHSQFHVGKTGTLYLRIRFEIFEVDTTLKKVKKIFDGGNLEGNMVISKMDSNDVFYMAMFDFHAAGNLSLYKIIIGGGENIIGNSGFSEVNDNQNHANDSHVDMASLKIGYSLSLKNSTFFAFYNCKIPGEILPGPTYISCVKKLII